ncbi:hypothetical protein EB796_022137 [Bugula neritina]|uniref:Uncharacterized protein n=1 Tax=Bugula neritina TaxID=10212 RepID=A0A7J7J1K9_BUGNE|nr:hypothetical protein EB796_022137 [Bugula neritina]
MISLEVNTSSLSHIEVTFFDILDDIVTAEEKRVGHRHYCIDIGEIYKCKSYKRVCLDSKDPTYAEYYYHWHYSGWSCYCSRGIINLRGIKMRASS